MPEFLLVHDPARVAAGDAVALARQIGIPQVVHGLAPWMTAQNLRYGPDGLLVVALCANPEHAPSREVLATWATVNDANKGMEGVEDHPYGKTPPKPVEDRLAALRAKPDLTAEDILDALLGGR